MHTESGSFRSLVEQKEKEIIGICEEQVFNLQHQLCAKEMDMDNLSARFLQLQDDFKYNLSLLDERDLELRQYDVSIPSLQASILEVQDHLNQSQEALLVTRTELSQEKERSKEMGKHYEHKLAKTISEIKKLKDEHCKQMKYLTSENTELKQEVAKQKHQLEQMKRDLENDYLEISHKKNMESEVAINELVTKLRCVESQVKHMRQSLDAEAQKHRSQKQLELELQTTIDEKDHEIQILEVDLSQAENELKTLKSKNECEARHVSDRIRKLEEGYKNQIMEMKEHIAKLDAKLEVSETHLKACEREKSKELYFIEEKLRRVEEEMAQREKHFNQKLENAEIDGHKALKLQEEWLQDVRKECEKWRSEYENVQIECNKLRKELLFKVESTKVVNRKGEDETPRGSVLSSIENWAFQLDGVNSVNVADHKTSHLENENRQLRASVQGLKDENARIQAAVETMRTEMEALQHNAMEEYVRSVASDKKGDDVQGLQAEIEFLKTRIANVVQDIQREKKQSKEVVTVTEEDELGRENGIMKTQLEGAISDIMRITNERDLLMELSNSLRADLNRVLIASSADHQVDKEEGKQEDDKEKMMLQVEGNVSNTHTRLPSENIIHKGTPSQQARLKLMMRRRDDAKLAKLKVRNYNIRDEN